jgi:hypothetical protein
MAKSVKNEGIQTQEALAILLHGGNCPRGYDCLAADCVECLERSMGKEVAGGAGD